MLSLQKQAVSLMQKFVMNKLLQLILVNDRFVCGTLYQQIWKFADWQHLAKAELLKITESIKKENEAAYSADSVLISTGLST
jgi:hypothetical protein